MYLEISINSPFDANKLITPPETYKLIYILSDDHKDFYKHVNKAYLKICVFHITTWKKCPKDMLDTEKSRAITLNDLK